MLCGNAKHTGCEEQATEEIVVVDRLDADELDALGLSALPPDPDDVIERLCSECADEYVNAHIELFESESLAHQELNPLERIKTGNGCADIWRDMDGFAYWGWGKRITTEDMEDEDARERLGPIVERLGLKLEQSAEESEEL